MTLEKRRRTIQSTWEPSEGETSLSVALEREGRDFLWAWRGRDEISCQQGEEGTSLPALEEPA